MTTTTHSSSTTRSSSLSGTDNFLSKRIKQLAREHKITSTKALARRIGVAPSSIRGVLAGSMPNSRTYAQYAAFVGLDPTQLRLRLEGNPSPTLDEHPQSALPTDVNVAVRAIEEHGIRRMLHKFTTDGIHVLRSLSSEDAARVVAYARRLASARP